tara:strand:- start:66 stop:632 length:567 start_codon:yes stop_codon:yes gene_type:complete
MVAEVLAGIALAKTAVTGIKNLIDTCNTVHDITHHVDDLLKAQDQIAAKKSQPQKGKKGNKEWNIHLTQQFKDGDALEGESLSDVTAEVIEQKQIEEAIEHTRRVINRRFGPGTWDEIMDLREKRVSENKIKRKQALKAYKEKQAKRIDFWYKLLIETSKVVGIIIFALAMYGYIAVNAKGQNLPWFW